MQEELLKKKNPLDKRRGRVEWGTQHQDIFRLIIETNIPVREQKTLPKEKHLEDKNYGTSNCGKIKNSPAGLRDTIRECSRS